MQKNRFFSNISFKAKKGETVAFIGATGSGKTSMINLIPRFYDVTEGEVLVDGVNVKTINKKHFMTKLVMYRRRRCYLVVR